MIDFYTWRTPNGHKVAIVLEELGLPYKLCPIDLTKQEQFSPTFLKINPNNKIPAIVDHEGPNRSKMTLFESGAILIYLAEKTGQLLSQTPDQRIHTLQWLMFQVGGIGPMFGQLNHFMFYAAKKVHYAIERYLNEVKRLYQVMDNHLEQNLYFVQDYSIADIAIYPWVSLFEWQQIDLQDYPHVARWYHAISIRPAVGRGLALIPR